MFKIPYPLYPPLLARYTGEGEYNEEGADAPSRDALPFFVGEGGNRKRG